MYIFPVAVPADLDPKQLHSRVQTTGDKELEKVQHTHVSEIE